MKKEITESQFYMWKAITALAHADNEVTHEEEAFLIEYIERLGFSPEQKESLRNELTRPSAIEDLFEKITNKVDRAHFIYFARLLFWSDGVFDEQEKKIHQFLSNKVLNRLDLQKIMKEAENEVEKAHKVALHSPGLRGLVESFFLHFFK